MLYMLADTVSTYETLTQHSANAGSYSLLAAGLALLVQGAVPPSGAGRQLSRLET